MDLHPRSWFYLSTNSKNQHSRQHPPSVDLALLPDIKTLCEIFNLTPPSTTDTLFRNNSRKTYVSLSFSSHVTTSITWTFEHALSNKNIQTQNVIIQDHTVPIVDITALSDNTALCEIFNLTPLSTTDTLLTNNSRKS